MGTTIDTGTRIAKLERTLIMDELSKPDFKDMFSDMMHITKVQLGTIEAKPAVWCDRMFELERLYGIHQISKQK